ncbi:MAG: hypothetical protein AAGF93_11135 [Cyanobacteria bacterium P01_H01_bin.105]
MSKSVSKSFGLGIFLSLGWMVAIAPAAMANAADFQRIEHPLAIKVGVTAVGLGCVGLELWWFLFKEK